MRAKAESRQFTLQPLCALKLAQISVERPDREMAVFSRELDDQIV
jgi:hypothetical protein